MPDIKLSELGDSLIPKESGSIFNGEQLPVLSWPMDHVTQKTLTRWINLALENYDFTALTPPFGVAGSDTQVQFNDGGVLGGDADFTWIKGSNVLVLGSTTGDSVSGSIRPAPGGTLVLFTSTPAAGIDAGDVEVVAANGSGSGDGGALRFNSGNGGSTGEAGLIDISAGNGGTSSNNPGGSVTITSGEGKGSGAGGLIDIVAGSGGTTGNGGDITVQAGDGGASGSGGDIIIVAGSSDEAGQLPGDIFLRPGSNTGSANRTGIVQASVSFNTDTSLISDSYFQIYNGVDNSDSRRKTGFFQTTGAGPGAAHAIVDIGSDLSYYIEVNMLARRTAGSSGAAGDSAAYKIIGLFKNISGTVTQVGTTTKTIIGEDQAGWDIDFAINGTEIQLQYTSAADNTVNWTYEVTYFQHSSG